MKPLRVNSKLIKTFQLSLHLVTVLWLVWVFYAGFTAQLPGDPVQYLLDFTGVGALNLLVASLSISVIAQMLKFGQIMVLRRPLGVYSAIYALAHFFVFIAFELQFELGLILSEIIDRPYITVGFFGFLILSTLAWTSFPIIKKKMGKSWQKVHNLSYLAIILACLHFLWLVKASWIEPAIYLALAISLLLLKRKKIKNIFN